MTGKVLRSWQLLLWTLIFDVIFGKKSLVRLCYACYIVLCVFSGLKKKRRTNRSTSESVTMDSCVGVLNSPIGPGRYIDTVINDYVIHFCEISSVR